MRGRHPLQPSPASVQRGAIAQFPRTPGGQNAAIAQPQAALPPVAAFEPVLSTGAPPALALPSTGVTTDCEAKTVQVTWPTSQAAPPLLLSKEVPVYTFTRQWRACDVYIQDTNLLLPGMVLSIRVYAVGTSQGAPTLVASGRVGLFSIAAAGAGQVIRVPLWIAAARSQAQHFQVTFQVEATTVAALPASSAQFSTITCVGTNEANDVPPLLGACRLGPTATATTWTTALDAELLMVQAVIGEAIVTPRYLHVHERSGAIAGLRPMYCFPLGAGAMVEGGGGWGGTFWFPPGLRPYGVGFYQVCVSSTANTTTAVVDCDVQGLYR